MTVFARFEFDDTEGYAHDNAPVGGDQLGIYLNGATATAGRALLDGQDDLVKIFPDPAHQMDQGTLGLSFRLGMGARDQTQTVLARDADGVRPGDFRVEALPDGTMGISHEAAGGTTSWQTAVGFAWPGDAVALSYSWDFGGAGGRLILTNATSGAGFSAAVPNTLSMQQEGAGQPWTIGAGQSHSPAGSLQAMDQFFHGSVAQFQLSDRVDNLRLGDGIVSGTCKNDLIDIGYTGDPQGDLVDAGDALLPGASPDDDRIEAGHGNDTVLAGEGNDLVFGGAGDDQLRGQTGDDTLLGEGGRDLVQGDEGNDLIIGGEGADLVDGGAGDDLIYGGCGPGVPDAINLPDDAGDRRPDNGADLLLGGTGNDTIFGMDDADTIYGGSGNDLLDGGIDNDLIQGDAGADFLSGGNDADTFVIGSAPDGAGDTVSGGSGGNDHDRLVLSGAGPYRLLDVVTDSDGNGIDGRVAFLDGDGHVTGKLTFSNIEEIVPCFTPGTLIATPRGEVPVEDLRLGDRVITRDDGLQEIRWLGHKTMDWAEMAANTHLRPVRITAGSLGDGLPERDMLVSPNHRMLVANDRTSLYFDEHEVLVAAKHLLSGSRIAMVEAAGLSYIHFMFDRHQVVLANGAWSESFQPGDYSLKGIGNAQRQELFELFPELKTSQGVQDYSAARRVLRRHEALLLGH